MSKPDDFTRLTEKFLYHPRNGKTCKNGKNGKTVHRVLRILPVLPFSATRGKIIFG
jgi:hypothetical protein